MRLSYSPAAHLFLFLVQWTDCHLAGALGLLRILIYKVNCFFFCTKFSVASTFQNIVPDFYAYSLPLNACFFFSRA